MIGVVANQYVGSACAYPLDDDGTLTTAFGFGYAGPAIGDGQTLGVNVIGGGGIRALLAADALTTARFLRGSSPIGYEAALITDTTAGADGFVAIGITNAGGTLVNAATVRITTLVTIEVAPDGTVSSSGSLAWLNPAGQKTVGATDFFSPYLTINEDTATSGYIELQLRTCAAAMTGTFTSGTVDIAGTVI